MEMSLFDFGDESVKEFLNTQKAEKEKKLEKKLEDTGLINKRATTSNNSSKSDTKSNTKVSKQVVPNADILKKCKACEKIVLKVYGIQILEITSKEEIEKLDLKTLQEKLITEYNYGELSSGVQWHLFDNKEEKTGYLIVTPPYRSKG